jgi:REP element-mobilizing transposase RayT
MDRFKNKYRIASARAQWWDYGWNGAYFITICTQNREHFFGEIKNGKMILSHQGVIADILWHEIPNHSPFADLGDFVVMPNHIHGILILNKPGGDGGDVSVVQTLHATSLQSQSQSQSQLQLQPPLKNEKMATISPKSNSVSTIIRSYKSAVTKHANRLGFENGWQPRFHDHIIRNDAEYQRISNYIINNPDNWKDDKFYSA